MADTLLNTNQINMGDVTGAYFELTKDMSDGKSTIATALSSKGIPSADTETLNSLGQKVGLLSTNASILYGRAVTGTSTYTYNSDFSLFPIHSRSAVIVVKKDGGIYFVPQYGHWTTEAQMFGSATFSSNLNSLTSQTVSSGYWGFNVSNNGRYAILTKGGTSNYWVISIGDDSFSLVDSYIAPFNFDSNGGFPFISSDSQLFITMQNYRVRAVKVGTSTQGELSSNSLSLWYEGRNISFALLKTGENKYLWSTVKAPNSTDGGKIYCNMVEITLGENDTMAVTVIARDTQATPSVMSYPGYVQTIVCSDNTACSIAFVQNKFYLINIKDSSKMLDCAKWGGPYYLAEYIVPFNDEYPDMPFCFFVKSYNDSTHEVVLDNISLPYEITINTETLQVVSEIPTGVIATKTAATLNYRNTNLVSVFSLGSSNVGYNRNSWMPLVNYNKTVGVGLADCYTGKPFIGGSTSDYKTVLNWYLNPVVLGYKTGNNVASVLAEGPATDGSMDYIIND